MAEFLWAESAGAERTVEPRIARTQFGDGYVQEAPDGLNPITEEWSFTLRGLDPATGNEVEAFLQARVSPVLGLEAFDWVPPWQTTALRWTCPSWKRTQVGDYGFSDIAVTFRRKHEA